MNISTGKLLDSGHIPKINEGIRSLNKQLYNLEPKDLIE